MYTALRIVIALVEIVGGLMGLAIVGPPLLSEGGFTFMAVVICGLFLLSTTAGLGLLLRQRWGLTLSLLLQAAQIPRIVTTNITYLFASGLGVWVYGGPATFGTQAQFGCAFQYRFETGFGPAFQSRPLEMGVNLVAAAVLVYLAGWGRLACRRAADAPMACPASAADRCTNHAD